MCTSDRPRRVEAAVNLLVDTSVRSLAWRRDGERGEPRRSGAGRAWCYRRPVRRSPTRPPIDRPGRSATVTPSSSAAGSDRGREVVAVLRMLDANGYHYLSPVALAAPVEHLWIVRPVPAPADREIPGSSYRQVGDGGGLGPLGLWRLYREVLALARRPEAGALVSFNPVPYGWLALVAGRRAGRPVHLGFVGSDWYRHCRSWYGGLLNRVFRRARLFTVTGQGMKDEMVAHGYPAQRIHVLPHAVDVERLVPTPPGERRYDLLFVGSLIRRKRVDLILEALARLEPRRPGVSLCVVGDGPERGALEQQAARLGLSGNVTFAGYQSRAEPWFSDARVVVIASDMEGYPFVLVEGACAGAVPVATRVGTIAELLEDGRNGLLIEPGDAAGLAAALDRVLGDEALYARLRAGALEFRERFRYERVAELWSGWLGELLAEAPEDR